MASAGFCFNLHYPSDYRVRLDVVPLKAVRLAAIIVERLLEKYTFDGYIVLRDIRIHL